MTGTLDLRTSSGQAVKSTRGSIHYLELIAGSSVMFAPPPSSPLAPHPPQLVQRRASAQHVIDDCEPLAPQIGVAHEGPADALRALFPGQCGLWPVSTNLRQVRGGNGIPVRAATTRAIARRLAGHRVSLPVERDVAVSRRLARNE